MYDRERNREMLQFATKVANKSASGKKSERKEGKRERETIKEKTIRSQTRLCNLVLLIRRENFKLTMEICLNI